MSININSLRGLIDQMMIAGNVMTSQLSHEETKRCIAAMDALKKADGAVAIDFAESFAAIEANRFHLAPNFLIGLAKDALNAVVEQLRKDATSTPDIVQNCVEARQYFFKFALARTWNKLLSLLKEEEPRFDSTPESEGESARRTNETIAFCLVKYRIEETILKAVSKVNNEHERTKQAGYLDKALQARGYLAILIAIKDARENFGLVPDREFFGLLGGYGKSEKSLMDFVLPSIEDQGASGAGNKGTPAV